MIDTTHFTPLGTVRAVERTERGVVLNVGDERFRVDVIRADLLRLKISQANVFDELPTHAASFEMPEPEPFEVVSDSKKVELFTRSIRLVISRQPFALAAYRIDGSVIFEDDHDSFGNPRGYLHLNDAWVVTRRIGPHDPIYGLGEKTGAFDRRGRNFILWNTDILAPDVLRLNHLHEANGELDGRSTAFDPYYTSIPFFYHCRVDAEGAPMAGFFVDNGYKAQFEFSGRDVYRYRFSGGQYTEYVFAGPGMPEILDAYTFITGHMEAPPMWSLGLHQCRFHDYTQKAIMKIGREYREREIPCDVLWLDIGYMNGYRVFTWDAQKFPDVPAMVEAMKESQFRLVVIVDPGVKFEPGYPVFEEGHARGLFCKTDSGKLYVGEVWPGRTVFPDFSREEVRHWWGELNARHASLGISGIWNDMNEPATGGVEPFAMRFDRDGNNYPHERFHNQYALLMAKGTHEGLKRLRPDERPFVLTRAGFAGIQRYAAQWTGDNHSDWSHLAMSVPMALGLSICGQSFVGSDIPGFMGRASAELSARWAQYGSLNPFCRYHNNAGEADHYPWSFGNGVERRSRAAIEQRYQLLPYIYTTFMQASEGKKPVIRPLVYEFQGDRQARETEDCFLFGDALLVAPVLEAGRTARNIYLPEGTWVDFRTGEQYDGGQFITAPAPLDSIPLFARGGRVIPMYDYAPQSTMGFYPESIDLHLIVPAGEGEFVSALHEDDGLTQAFTKGAYLKTSFLVTRRGNQIRLRGKTTGKGFPEFRRERLRVVLHGDRLGQVRLNGKEISLESEHIEFPNRGEDFDLEIVVATRSQHRTSAPRLRALPGE